MAGGGPEDGGWAGVSLESGQGQGQRPTGGCVAPAGAGGGLRQRLRGDVVPDHQQLVAGQEGDGRQRRMGPEVEVAVNMTEPVPKVA